MKTKTCKLTGVVLDWAVAKCEGLDLFESEGWVYLFESEGWDYYQENGKRVPYRPSIKWAQGGPIIEREKICFNYFPDGGHEEGGEWLAEAALEEIEIYGPTALIAAMRCYVASKLGEEIDVPEELVDL
jgi:hypothetical protein